MEKDLELKHWLEFHNRRYLVVATKTDKLKTQKEQRQGMAAIRSQSPESEPLPFSAVQLPGSEGNLASDLENQDPAAVAAPTDQKNPETKTEGNAPARRRKPKPQTTARPPNPPMPSRAMRKPAADKADANGKARRPPARPGAPASATAAVSRRQANQKNGTLDLVELKDMSIQKLNQIAKDLGVTASPDCASRS